MGKNIKKFIYVFFVLAFLTSCSSSKIMQYKIYGIDYLENANYEEALDYFNKALNAGNGQVGKEQYDLLLYKAECLFMLKRYSEAKSIYGILLKIYGINQDRKMVSTNITGNIKLDFGLWSDKNLIAKPWEKYIP